MVLGVDSCVNLLLKSVTASNHCIPECVEGDVFMEVFLEEMVPSLGFAE